MRSGSQHDSASDTSSDIQGEGDREADRRYRRAASRFAGSDELASAAREAKQSLVESDASVGELEPPGE